MGIQRTYRKSGESSTTSYNYSDIASGLGYVTFKGITTDGTTYDLIQQSGFSKTIFTSRAAAGTTTMNFDTSTFNTTRYVDGTAFLEAGIFGTAGTNMHITAQLKKVAADTTVSNISSEISSVDTNVALTIFLKIALTGTNLGIGDKLRLVIKIVSTTADVAGIAHDPENRDTSPTYITPSSDTSHKTVMTFYVPFRINL